MLTCGIDVGSAQTKCVIMDGNSILQGRGIVRSGANLARAARHALKEALLEAEVEEYDLSIIIGTGYGRHAIPMSHKNVSEAICLAKGAKYRYPGTRTILDLGGQDTTAIKIDQNGNVVDFAMNDKCSAGTGRFLQSLSGLLNTPIEDFARLETSADTHLMVTNVCSVFVEQEIINYLEEGKEINDILAGVFDAVARRATSIVRRIGLEEELTLSGGVSTIKGVVKALEEILGIKSNSGIDAVYIGALGAALTGLEK